MSQTHPTWKPGDRVIHPARPEWGSGEVLKALPSTHEGRPCQRLDVRFERIGLKTLSTAIAELRPASQAPSLPPPAPAHAGEPDPLQAHASKELVEEAMTRLPEEATDPFIPLPKRLEHALKLYRFAESPASLLDWATAQTGLKDPMTRFSRHDLEMWFDRYRIGLDAHVRKLARDLRKASPGAIDALAREASPAARAALRRFDAQR